MILLGRLRLARTVRIKPAVERLVVIVALMVVRRFPWIETVPYIAAQLVGAFGGGVLIVAIFGKSATDLNDTGATVLGTGVTHGQAVETTTKALL